MGLMAALVSERSGTGLLSRPTVAVTVLICTRDRARQLWHCLRAILDGSVLPETVLVVDQSRGDDTRLLVETLGSKRSRPVLCRLRSEGGGLAVAQNLGFRSASTPVVLVTDDDCLPDRRWVERAAAAFAADPSLGLLAGRVLPAGPDVPGLHGVSLRTSTVPLDLDESSMPWDVGSGNNFGVTIEALRLVGGNDERLGPGAPLRGGADMDLFRRLLRAGARGRYDPALVVEHERATTRDRLRRRVPYGYGLGVACALWWRQGDGRSAEILRRWLGLRGHRLTQGLRHGPRLLAREELLVLLGTARGLVHGALLRPGSPVQSEPMR
jgi:GT2 family glycosyltransferase